MLGFRRLCSPQAPRFAKFMASAVDPEDFEGDQDVCMDASADGGDKADRERWPKRKVAMVVGYCGTGYQGLQLCVYRVFVRGSG